MDKKYPAYLFMVFLSSLGALYAFEPLPWYMVVVGMLAVFAICLKADPRP